MYTLQTVRKVSVSYLYNLYPLREPYAILKQQEERLLILSIERKTCMEPRVTLPQQQKTFITLSIERKVFIIGVQI